jgi:hypothetical protein
MKGYDLDALLPEQRKRLEDTVGMACEFAGRVACRALLVALDHMNRRPERPSEEKWVLASVAQKIVDVSAETLREWGVSGKVACRRTESGKRWLYRESDLLREKERRYG